MENKLNIWNDCEQKELTSLLSFIVDNRGKTVPVIDDSNGIKLIATNCIKNESLYPIYEKVRYLSEDTYKNWFRAHPVPGDIIFVNKGTPGKVAFVPNPVDFCIAQDMMAFRCKSGIIYNKYLFAVLRNPKIQEQIRITSVGDVIPHFKKEFLSEIKIPVPDMKIQKYLGDMYFMYSEKIELNNKINTNLELRAQALFKSWFVDFEPFGGEMPSGWKERPLYEYADFINGTSFKEDEYGTVGVPIIKIAELKNGITDATQYFNSTKDSKYDVKDGDILFSWSGNPETSIDIFIWTLGNAILNQHTFNVKSNTNRKWFTYCLLKYFKPEFCHRAGCKQTTGLGHVTANDLKQIMFSSDEKSEIDFEKLITPVMEQVYNNKVENQKLASIRDTLLPKLMNGEIEKRKE